jgi:hypothetical protein
MAIERAPYDARHASLHRKQRGGWIGFRRNCSRAEGTMTEKSEEMGKIVKSPVNQTRIEAYLISEVGPA